MFGSTNHTDDRRVDLATALRHPIPEPGHLWTIREVPSLSALKKIKSDPVPSFRTCLAHLLDAFGFPISLPDDYAPDVRLAGRQLELFHGPTQSFKDIGCRVAVRTYKALFPNVPVLAATSGDTGGAVAHACVEEGVRGIVLYPKDGISPYQESQMVGLPGVAALAVEGDFDACQAMVKKALRRTDRFLSCNSVSLARLLPQAAAYVWLSFQRPGCGVTVPSGNLGNATSFLIARKMCCPLGRIRVATNANDAAVRFLTGKDAAFAPKPTVRTVSTAMDVGAPSNAVRLFEMWEERDEAVAVYDSSIVHKIAAKRQVCPHTAVGYLAAEDDDVVVATADPLKFLLCAHVSPDALLLSPDRLLHVPYRTVVLVGMPGTGKTTLAHRMGGKDLDDDVDFALSGPAFLAHEQRQLQRLCDRLDRGTEEAQVYATGGSVVYGRGAALLKNTRALVVWLEADVGTLEERCGDLAARGVVLGTCRGLADLARERAPLYRTCADLRIDTGRHSIDDVRRILASLLPWD